MKKKIIVPVDFSSASRNAYHYALEMAREYDSSLELVHVYSGSFTTLEPPVLVPSRGMEEVLDQELSNFAHINPKSAEGAIQTRVQVSTRLIVGSTVEVLRELSEEEDTFMIIMGATGKHDAVDKLFGSISSLTAQKAACPVVLVPKTASYRNFEKILYASNFDSADERMVGEIKKLAGMFQASVYFVHISPSGDEKEDLFETRNKIVEGLFKDSDPGFSFQMDTLKAETVFEGLSKYVEEHELDLMVIVNRHRGFLESMLGKSLTKQIALRPKLPVLIYHI